jgi:2-keto-4-pentenoate hydratase/2-oxohepta-3-ene-1,7-dioic acid hydratase in catechol pathway
MKLCRFNNGRLGVVDGDSVLDVTSALELLPKCTYPLPRHDLLIENLEAVRSRVVDLMPSAQRLPHGSVQLVSPVANPGKILGAPVNYTKHLEEAREQASIHHNNRIEEIRRVGLFLKANSSLVGAGEGVAIEHPTRRNDHEAELVVIIGKRVRNLSRDDAMSCIAGYCSGLDMTTRGPEERSLRKSIDSYSVVGPWLVTPDELTNPHALDFTLSVNGEARQCANTRDLVIGIADLLVFASSFYTLEPGDLLFTGTPEGVGPVVPGDVIVTDFEGIGRMTVAVRGRRAN